MRYKIKQWLLNKLTCCLGWKRGLSGKWSIFSFKEKMGDISNQPHALHDLLWSRERMHVMPKYHSNSFIPFIQLKCALLVSAQTRTHTACIISMLSTQLWLYVSQRINHNLHLGFNISTCFYHNHETYNQHRNLQSVQIYVHEMQCLIDLKYLQMMDF